MVITGSAILVKPGMDGSVLLKLGDFPEVTFYAKSELGTELVVNLEAEDLGGLEELCLRIKNNIPGVVDITHVYVNFEEQVEKAEQGLVDKRSLSKPKFGPR